MKKNETNTYKVKKDINSAKTAVLILGIVYVLITILCFIKPDAEYSISERRKLAQKPDFSWEALGHGDYIEDVEEYVVDQFPFRDQFRAIKTYFSLGVMQKQDTNGIYVKNGYLCEMEYPMDESSLDRAADIFTSIYKNNIEGTDAKTYLAVILDKNYFLSNNNSVLAMDYNVFFKKMYEKTPFLQVIDIAKTLELTDYYKTDSHWKQECIIDTAASLAERMEAPFISDFAIKRTESPFYGVYYGQAGIKMAADEIRYCTSPLLDSCRVFDYENNKEISLYDVSKVEGRDPYEMFLGGNISLLTIENEDALSSKELVVFGDSFSRSLVPLLAGSYQKITMMDIRYLPSLYVEKYIEFTNQDVLFLYSTSVLNNSITLK